MNILIIGAAGSGKGTMSEKIVGKYHLPHISTGDMFRQAIAEETPLGLEVKDYLDGGLLVPDKLTVSLVRERIEKSDNGYLLDGFPRSLSQAKALDEMTEIIKRPLDIVINLVIDVSILADRVVGRRICLNCGAIYNVTYSPPQTEGICDLCNSELIHRSDDTIENLATRLEIFETSIKPVIDYYRNLNLVVDIDAGQEINAVWHDIESTLGKLK